MEPQSRCTATIPQFLPSYDVLPFNHYLLVLRSSWLHDLAMQRLATSKVLIDAISTPGMEGPLFNDRKE